MLSRFGFALSFLSLIVGTHLEEAIYTERLLYLFPTLPEGHVHLAFTTTARLASARFSTPASL